MTTPKEIYKRLKFAEAMKRKIAKADAKILVAREAKEALIATCPHYHSWYKNCGSSSGSWDQYDEHYWSEYHCEDCGHRWNTDQSYENRAKYPYAVDRTHDR